MSAKCESSTRFGSMRTTLTSSGVVRMRIEVTNVLIRLDLPAPVAPAISTCGISARFTRTARPWTSFPRPTNNDLVTSRAAFEDSTSPSITKSLTLFGTSTPMADLPGIGAMIRTSGVARAYAMSSPRESTRFTFVPASTSTSYIVTVGPRWAATTLAATPKVRNVRSRAAVVCSASLPSAVVAGARRKSSSGGSR